MTHSDDLPTVARLYIGRPVAHVLAALKRTTLPGWTIQAAHGAWTLVGGWREEDEASIVTLLDLTHAQALTYTVTLRGLLCEKEIILLREAADGPNAPVNIVHVGPSPR